MIPRQNVHGLRQGVAHLKVLRGRVLGHFGRRVKEEHRRIGVQKRIGAGPGGYLLNQDMKESEKKTAWIETMDPRLKNKWMHT